MRKADKLMSFYRYALYILIYIIILHIFTVHMLCNNMKAFAYIRVSGSGQVNGGGFDRQLKSINNYSKAHGVEVVEVYREEGISGTLENRPALAKLLISLEQNGHGIRAVIICCTIQ